MASAAANPSYILNDLIFPGGTTSFTAAYGINDQGTVVGYYQSLNTGNEKLGFYGSTFTELSLQPLNLSPGTCTPNGSVGVFPTGINNSGTIVGTFSGTSCGNKNGFITTNNGVNFTAFSPPASSVPSGHTLIRDFGASISNSGEVTGYAIGRFGTSFSFNGFTTSDEINFNCVIDPNAAATGATLPAGINANGEIVGFYFNRSGSAVGFLLSGGYYYDVIVPGSYNFTDPTSIDTKGDIVGFYKDANGVSHGFIWTGYTASGAAISGGTVTTLDDPNAGNNGGNGEGTQIFGISPDGKEIVGLYKNCNGTNGFYGISSITTLTSSANPLAFGKLVTFTASITPSTASGTVTFSINGVQQGAPVILSDGAAQYTASSFAVGSYSVVATYSGDSTYGGSTSNTVTQTVETSGPDFNGEAASATVTANGTGGGRYIVNPAFPGVSGGATSSLTNTPVNNRRGYYGFLCHCRPKPGEHSPCFRPDRHYMSAQHTGLHQRDAEQQR